jgi:hypothetical protein
MRNEKNVIHQTSSSNNMSDRVNTAPDFPSFETLLTNQWADMMHSDQQQQVLLQSGLVPLVVEASAALLNALEKEASEVQSNPAAKPKQPIQPLIFIASYLMRNNPKHKYDNFGVSLDFHFL